MKRYLIIILSVISFVLPAKAQDFYGYTKDRPLVIVCDWDFRPFEFIDSDGQPAGYNIEVLSLILNNLNIPHQFLMEEWQLATRTFEAHEADLIHALSFQYKRRPFVSTKQYVNYYKLSAARKVTTPPYTHIHDLHANNTIAVKPDDYATLALKATDTIPCKVNYCTPKDGLSGVISGAYDYFIWGDVPLKRKAKELALDSLAFDEVDLPAGELCMIGYDNDIIEIIDDEYTRLEQNGELQQINDKWFHPEKVHDNASPLSIVILISLLVIVGIVIILAAVMYLRAKNAFHRNKVLHNMMEQALAMGDYYVLEYDIETHRVSNLYGHLLPEGGVSFDELANGISDEGREDFRQCIESLERGETEEQKMKKTYNSGTADKPVWRTYDGVAILERKEGQPRYIFHSFKDVSRDMEEEKQNKELANYYKMVFDTNLIAMSFYSANGMLLDFNQKMYELCNMNEETERFFRTSSIYDDPHVSDILKQDKNATYHGCHRMYYPEQGIDKYIEIRMQPLFDDLGKLVYYIVTSYDITAERDIYMKQREHDRKIQEANKQIKSYEAQLRYLLEESKMYVWTFDIEKLEIRFTRSLREMEHVETIDEYLAGMDIEDRVKQRQDIIDKVTRHKPYHGIHHFQYTPLSPGNTWYSISGIPMYDNDGSVTKYFGLVRDITDLMEAQQKLREETARAEDSGRMKAAFLANMTHEIRTPLNAIVGFSDILQMVEEPDERMEFIRIIRTNCDMLLRLINDILEASSMGQALAIKPEKIDVSKVFDDICQTLAQRVQEPGVEFQKDSPPDTYSAVLDKGRLQQMLTNFVTNAVKYTHEGHIRVGWKPMSSDELKSLTTPSPKTAKEGLYFYCEDTGAGIPKEKQASVFERFVKLNDYVQGTGLGLSICKAITERSGGYIGVFSEGEGHGSTFWFWIPREVIVNET